MSAQVAVEPDRLALIAGVLGVQTEQIDAVISALRGLGNPVTERSDGEGQNPLLLSVGYEMALDEMDAEPLPSDFPDTEEGSADYAEAVSRWHDVLDAVAYDRAATAAHVLGTAASLLRRMVVA